ncbi:MAG: hypothetical protein JXQ84_01740 [Rhodospirillaceae bacterium]|nr:hypothetical protein [Rhodospirillaceae bacterium]
MGQVESYLERRFSENRRVRECLTGLFKRYDEWGLKDTKFDTDFTSGRDEHFFGYLWEMLLASHLKGLGLDLQSKDEGPDFCFLNEGRKIWVEAVCPGPEGLPDDWLVLPDIREPVRVRDFPHEQLLLRWTAALKEKKEKLSGHAQRRGNWRPGYLETGIVGIDDPYVVAVSACRLGLPSFLLHEGISELPYAVEAAFPVGPIEIVIDRDTMEIVDQRLSYRRIVKNHNGADVPTDNFLNPDYSGVSAILGTPAGINAACGENSPLVVVHNPLADNPLPYEILGADQEYVAEDRGDYYELREIRNG